MKKITIAGLVGLLLFLGTRIYFGIRFDQDIGGHLKLAADANTTLLAQKRLKVAIDNMDAWGLCNRNGDNCFTSIIYRTPDEDVGFWRSNIEATYEDLSGMTDEDRADNLIESNQLMKVRETLLDTGAKGDKVTAPEGISIYPNNMTFAIFGWGLLIFFGIFVFKDLNDY